MRRNAQRELLCKRMKLISKTKGSALILIPLFLALTPLLSSLPFFVRGQNVGTVCIAEESSTSCPSTPPNFSGAVGTQLTVSVNIQGSDPLETFDISVHANPVILEEASVSLAGSVISNPLFLCNPCFTQPGTIEMIAAQLGGFTNPPPSITGRLFSITYNIVGTTPGTGIVFPSDPACLAAVAPHPTTSNDSFCVTILPSLTSSPAILPENLQTATFSNQGLLISKFFTDSSLNPLSLDNNGNPMVNGVLTRGFVRSTNPGQVLVWVNVTNTGSASVQSLKLNETLPVDRTVSPPWLPGKGSIHVYYANTTSIATNPEITDPSTIAVTTGNPQTVLVAISSLNATGIDHPLMRGQSILLSVKLSYGLVMTSQSASSYPRNYTDTASASAWTMPSYTGTESSATGSAFFIAYAMVVGDVLVSFGSLTVRAMVSQNYWIT